MKVAMNLFSKKRVFLDYAGGQDNPSAIYTEGIETRKKLENARTKIARILHVGSKDIIFTSGGTESDNLAILGVFEATKISNLDLQTLGVCKPHIIISSVEHPAIVKTAKEVERRGGEVTIAQVDEDGRVSPQEIMNAIKENTVLVSVCMASGETGAIQPISKIGRMIREYRKEREADYPYLHTDASQVGSLLDLNVESLRVDLMTLDSYKVYGPYGVGCLVARPNVDLYPIMFGGGQERGLRPGTENVFGIYEFVEALGVANQNREKEYKRLKLLREYFIEEVHKKNSNLIIKGSKSSDYQLPNIVSFSIPDILAEFVAIKLDQRGVAVSVGSACNSRKNEPDKENVRISFGKSTTKKDIVRAIKAL